MAENTYRKGPQVLVSFVAVFSAITIGGCVGLSAVMIPALQEEEDEQFRIDLKTGSHFVTLWIGPSMFGCMLGGWVADHIGRRKVIMWSQIPYALSWAFIAMSGSITHIFLARAITGFSEGLLYTLLPVYISEITTPDMRAIMCNQISVFTNVGILVTYTLGATVHWRLLNWTMCVFNSISFLSMAMLLYETPYFLVSMGNVEQAKATLQKLRGQNYDVSKELDEIVARKKHKDDLLAGGQHSKLKMLLSPSFIIPYMSVGITYALSQCSGSSTLALFIINIFQDSGTNINPYLASVVVVFLRVCFSLASSVALKLLRRKTLFGIAGLTMFTGFLCLAGLTHLRERQEVQADTDIFLANNSDRVEISYSNYTKGGLDSESIQSYQNGSNFINGTQIISNHTARIPSDSGGSDFDWLMHLLLDWAPIASVLLIFAAQTFGVSNVLRVCIGEVFPTEIRSLASAICLFFANIAVGLCGIIFPYLLDWFDYKGTFGIFGISTLVLTVYGYMSLPDSKEKTLVKMEEHFERQYNKKLSLKQKKVAEENI